MKNKYVLILSDEDDSTTDDVLDWLEHDAIPLIRIDGTNDLLFCHGVNNYLTALNVAVNYKHRSSTIQVIVLPNHFLAHAILPNEV